MYMHGPYTDSILKSCGIKVCSDGVKKQSDGLIQIENDYYHFPINTIPDHEHIIHAERTPEWISDWQKRYNWSDDFGPESYHISEWTDILLRQLEENEKNGVISNLMIHPITMYLCDQFESFKKILSFIQDKQTCTVNDLYNQYSKSV